MDTRGSKGERETKDLSEKDCRKRKVRRGGRKSWNVAKAAARDKGGGGGLGGQCDGPMRLLAQ